MLGAHGRQIIGGIALALWLASLALPVETDCGQRYADAGYLILMIGWIGVFVGLLGWYANPFMLGLILVLLLDKRPSIIAALIGLGLALTALWWTRTPTDNGYSTICAHHTGFYVWIACAVLLAAVALVEWPGYMRKKYPRAP
jgi:hypothetical protein